MRYLQNSVYIYYFSPPLNDLQGQVTRLQQQLDQQMIDANLKLAEQKRLNCLLHTQIVKDKFQAVS